MIIITQYLIYVVHVTSVGQRSGGGGGGGGVGGGGTKNITR